MPEPAPTRPATTRRAFIAGAAAAGFLAACTGSDGDPATSGSAPGTGAGSTVEPGASGVFTLVQRFPPGVQVPGDVRLPISLSTGAAEFVQDGPPSLGAQVTDLDGAPIGDRITAVRRATAPAPYYAFRPTIDRTGFYALVVDGGPAEGIAFQVNEPEAVPIPLRGDLLPGFDTPTIGDPAGVDAICTRTPEMCPFHTITLSAALNVDRPVVYCVGTPAFCTTGSCGPALESMIEVFPEYGDRMTFVHAEVFSDDAGTVVAPAVEALGMFYEPALFVTDAGGTIVERLDGLWDTTELVETLDKALG